MVRYFKDECPCAGLMVLIVVKKRPWAEPTLMKIVDKVGLCRAQCLEFNVLMIRVVRTGLIKNVTEILCLGVIMEKGKGTSNFLAETYEIP